MKKIIFTLIAIGMVSMSTMSMAAMSLNKVRQETRFLTDKMAYELDLSTDQYNDTYEINYDFIYNVRYIMDDVIFGYDWLWTDIMNILISVMMIFAGFLKTGNTNNSLIQNTSTVQLSLKGIHGDLAYI